MRFLLLLSILFGLLQLQAQTFTISGVAENQPNKLVRVIAFADQFSMLEKTIASVRTDNNGSFVLTAEIKQTQLALLALDLKKAEIVLEPNGNYNLKILNDTSGKGKSIYEQNPLMFEFIDNNELNSHLQQFNVMYNTFLLKNFNAIYRSRSSSIIYNFRVEVDSIFNASNNLYLNHSIKYKIASLELASRRLNENKLIEEYFVNNDILYNNIEYSSLFKEVFNNYFFSGSSGIDYAKLIETANYSTNFNKIDELIAIGNPLLAFDRRLRELIAIVGLAKLYNTKEFNRVNIIKLLRQVERNSKFAEHGEIAGNYIIKLQKLSYGSMAPDFELTDQNGNTVKLNDLKGKFTLLSFMEGDCKICISHISLLDELRQMFKGKLQNVSFVSGGNESAVSVFMEERDYNWPVLSVTDLLLLEAYNVRVFPTYILLNPDGSIAMATAPMPDENLAAYINGLMNKWEARKVQSE